MAGPYDATTELLDERPKDEDVLDTLVALDADGPWTFDDVDCDSGTFGEIVSREFVESVDGGYRLVDREATRVALKGEEYGTETNSGEAALPELSLPAVRPWIRTKLAESNSTFLVALVVSLAFLFVMRTIRYGEVFRDGRVVLPGNDPYLHRSVVDRLLAESPGLFAFGDIADVLGRRATGEPLTQVLGWWLTVIFGFSPETSGAVIAWFPVVAALSVGVLVAWMALAVTDDERVAVLSVVIFAVTPAHALYSGLGFFDHSFLDYLWLASMAASLVWLAGHSEARPGRDHVTARNTWLVTLLFGVAVAMAVLTWSGAPVLLSGIALYAVVRPASDLRAGHSPIFPALPLVGGLLVGTVIAGLAHTGAGWQEAEIIYAPGLLAVGALAVASFSEATYRLELDPRLGVGGSVVVGFAMAVSVQLFASGFVSRYRDRFFEDLLGREEIAETRGLFVPELSVTFGPLEQFGLLLVFALPAFGYIVYHCIRKHDPSWLVLVSFALPLLGFATIQRRFAGELSVFVAIFAATGLVWALSSVSLCRSPFSDGSRTAFHVTNLRSSNQALYLSFILLVVVTVGIIFTVGIMGTVTITDEEYEAATWIAEDSGGEDSLVLSRWGRHRMYNYFSGSGDMNYGFAQQNYRPFLETHEPDAWYGNLASVRYIVVQDFNLGLAEANSTYIRLSQALGSSTDRTEGVGHYQFAYLTQGQSLSVFKPVAGALIEGNASVNETVTVETTVEFDADVADRLGAESFTYRREVTADGNGTFGVRVAYPGTYSIGNRTVDVSSADVREGRHIEVTEEDEE